MTDPRVAPAVVRVTAKGWIRVGVGALAFIVTALAAALLVAQTRGQARDRIIGQLACQVQRLGGRPVDGASCPPTPTPSPAPSPGVSRETRPPTIIVTSGPGGRPTVVVVPAPAGSSGPSPRRSGSPAPSPARSSPRPSPTPTCTRVPVISVCQPTPPAP